MTLTETIPSQTDANRDRDGYGEEPRGGFGAP
jgi:hypothetical protein